MDIHETTGCMCCQFLKRFQQPWPPWPPWPLPSTSLNEMTRMTRVVHVDSRDSCDTKKGLHIFTWKSDGISKLWHTSMSVASCVHSLDIVDISTRAVFDGKQWNTVKWETKVKSTRLLKMKQIQGIKWIKVGSRSVFLTCCNNSSSAKMFCYLHVATLLPFLQVFLNMFHGFTSWYFPRHLQVIHFIKKRSNMGLQKKQPPDAFAWNVWNAWGWNPAKSYWMTPPRSKSWQYLCVTLHR